MYFPEKNTNPVEPTIVQVAEEALHPGCKKSYSYMPRPYLAGVTALQTRKALRHSGFSPELSLL